MRGPLESLYEAGTLLAEAHASYTDGRITLTDRAWAERAQVAVARALVGSPFILLADEPTGNLDSRNGEQIMLLMDELHKSGATICMVTHDPRIVDVADRLLQMEDGRLKNAV